ncbi:MAG: GrpB family protein [bacterium]|nr:GrpB family protein [bacterium]
MKIIPINNCHEIDAQEKIKHVELTPPNLEWPRLFNESANEIKNILGENCIAIHHIGSTAISNIYAKPIVDILLVVKEIKLVDSLNSKFEALGYVCMGEYGISGRRFYWKSKDTRTHNIHLFEEGSSEILRHVSFRDFMRNHEDYAKAYSVLKCCLAEVFTEDIENYVNGKSSFVQQIDYQTGTAREKQLNAQDNIVIQPYNPAWPKLAIAEIKAIKTIANQDSIVSIDHIGSTAVPELSSKPIIDIFISITSLNNVAHWISSLQSLGYIYWEENPDKTHLRFFKGMPPFGEGRTHHVHIVEANNHTVEHRLLFRDILRRDKRARLDYESLKRRLAQSDNNDREAYTDNKLDFITSLLRANGYKKPISRH